MHPERQELVALADGGLIESEALRIRSHLEGCVQCRGEAAALKRLAGALAFAPAASLQVVIPKNAPGRRGWVLAAAAALMLPLGLYALSEDTAVARGSASQQRVHAQFFRPQGDDFIRLADGDDAPRELTVVTRVVVQPGDDERFFALIATDAEGRVTWLRPRLSAGATMLRVGDERRVIDDGEGMSLPRLPSGTLRLSLLLSKRAAQIVDLDAVLESGKRPEAIEYESLILYVE